MTPDIPFFKPKRVQIHPEELLDSKSMGGDARDGRIYVYNQSDIPLAVNVALATRRPLLLSGPSGCGKSCLALNVALTLGWRYYEYVVTAQSEARDVLWSFDSLRRLNDAQARDSNLRSDPFYVEPGVLWWALDPETAQWRGQPGQIASADQAKDPSLTAGHENSVVLIDEIDKADPDFPNNLLVPLGSLQFHVAPSRYTVKGKHSPLIFITTNRERELPRAFLRRCVALVLHPPTTEDLVEIANSVIPEEDKDQNLFRRLAEHVLRLEKTADDGPHVSTAEYLDTVRACIRLQIRPDSEQFSSLSRITLQKNPIGNFQWP